jgi:hypothetical protein
VRCQIMHALLFSLHKMLQLQRVEDELVLPLYRRQQMLAEVSMRLQTVCKDSVLQEALLRQMSVLHCRCLGLLRSKQSSHLLLAAVLADAAETLQEHSSSSSSSRLQAERLQHTATAASAALVRQQALDRLHKHSSIRTAAVAIDTLTALLRARAYQHARLLAVLQLAHSTRQDQQ